MHPEEAIHIIEASFTKYNIRWINTGRKSSDWKIKIYEQAGTGLQLAIYARKGTVLLLEHRVADIDGVELMDGFAKSSGLTKSFHFNEQVGIRVAVKSAAALELLLEQYFSQTEALETDKDVSAAFERGLAEAKTRSQRNGEIV